MLCLLWRRDITLAVFARSRACHTAFPVDMPMRHIEYRRGGGEHMKIVVVKSPRFFSGILKKIFKVK